MQIKRFEAADMTEALRMVKREFGDDAVILSAKEVRPGGFFSALRKKSVEITAAADYPADDGLDSHAFSGLLAQQLDDGSPTDRVSLSASPSANKAFLQKTLSFRQPSGIPEKDAPIEKRIGSLPRRLNQDGAKPVPAETIRRAAAERSRAGKSAVNDLPGNPEADNLIAAPFYGQADKHKTIALVGPSGAGKSTTLAKLARHCREVEKRITGLISLDRFRIGANGMLERVARIMDLPLAIVHDAGQLQLALNELAETDVVLIDTPGMGSADRSMLDDVGRLLRLASPDETHLVVNATVRDDVLAATVNTFLPLGANRLLFTHMDASGGNPTVLTLLKETRLPSSFYCDGVDLFDHLQEASFDRLSDFCSPVESSGGRMKVLPGQGEPRNTPRWLRHTDAGSVKYVANRNSELFHHPHCKSVKRINAENIAAFKSIEQAMGEGFKPCRACCCISTIGKSMMEAIGGQRVSAL